jgi:hypothetical protein
MVAEFGFLGLEQLYHDDSQIVNLEVVWNQVLEAVRAYNEAVSGFISTFAQPTTQGQFRYIIPNTLGYQPLDDKGEPLPAFSFGHYDAGLPLRGAGLAWGENMITRAMLTPRKIAERTMQALRADAEWIQKHMLAALFTNTEYNYSSNLTPEENPVTVRPLATTASGLQWLMRDGVLATDQHYNAQANPIDNSNNPFPAIYEELAEHPSNGVAPTRPVIAYIPANLQQSVEGLASFVPLARTFIAESVQTPTAMPEAANYGSFGEFIGVVGGANNSVIVRVWRALPDNYIIAHASGAGPVLGWRQFPQPELQGVIAMREGAEGSNYIKMSFRRYAGFGVVNPIAACVWRIGNASYAVPNNYQAPLVA